MEPEFTAVSIVLGVVLSVVFGADVLPALVGVDCICGAKVSSYLLSGAVLGWFVIMPLLVLVDGDPERAGSRMRRIG